MELRGFGVFTPGAAMPGKDAIPGPAMRSRFRPRRCPSSRPARNCGRKRRPWRNVGPRATADPRRRRQRRGASRSSRTETVPHGDRHAGADTTFAPASLRVFCRFSEAAACRLPAPRGSRRRLSLTLLPRAPDQGRVAHGSCVRFVGCPRRAGPPARVRRPGALQALAARSA